MALTDIELRKIHQKGTAIPNRRYASLDGTTYIGLANGRLQKRDVGLINLENEVSTIELTPGPAGEQGIQGEQGEQGVQGETGPQGESGVDGADGIGGIKFLIDTTDDGLEKLHVTVAATKEYYIHRNYEIADNASFTVDSGAQLCIGDGILRLGAGSTITNNGQIILT